MTKGPKFCPTTKGNSIHIKADIRNFTRRLKLLDIFYEVDYTCESLVKHPSSFNPKPSDPEIAKIITNIENVDPMPNKNGQDNLTKSERAALKELEDMLERDLVIKKADKGNTLVIMDIDFYKNKLVIDDHLNSDTYCEANPNSDSNVMSALKVLMNKHRECLFDKEYEYIVNFEWKSSNIYVLPKIHKCREIIDTIEDWSSSYIHMETPYTLKGRPVIAGPASPTQHLSELIEKILSPLVPNLQSYVKDDWDFLRKFPSELDPACDIFSCDIVSLYTNITHDLGLRALDFWITKFDHLIPSRFTKEFILESAHFILTNNYFKFDNVLYLQLIGTAIGTIFAPPYACLTCGYLEVTKLYPALIS